MEFWSLMSGTERKFATNWSGNIAAVKIFWMGAMTDSGAKMTTVSGFVDIGSHLLVFLPSSSCLLPNAMNH